MLEPTRAWRLTAAGMALVSVCYGLARFAYGLFLPDLRVEFTLSDTLLGTVAAGSYVGYCLAVLVSAEAVARVGSRATAVAAGTIAACGMAVVAVSPNAWVLAAGVLVAGTSTGVVSPPFAAAIAQVVPRSRHDRAQAVVNAGPGLGIAVSGVVLLLAVGDWRIAWLLFVAVAAAVTVWAGVAMPCGVVAPPRRGLVTVIGTAASWRLAAGAGMFGAASSAVWIFGRDHVTRASELGQTESVLLWIALGVSELFGVAAGDVIIRWGLHRTWMASLGLLAGATAIIGLMPASRAATFIAIVVFGACYVTLTTVVFLWATRLHPDHPAPSVAFGFLAISAGQACASPLAGAIADHAGTTPTFILCATVGVLAAWITAPKPRLA